MSDPLDSIASDILAALDPPGAIHPGLAQHVTRQLRLLRSKPTVRVDAMVGAELCRPYLRGFPIDGVAISTLGGSFGGETVAASDSTAARLDEIQLDLGQGPCWDAIATAGPISVLDTVSEDRWPLFADAVADIDIRAVFAFPLRFAGLSIGAVDVYSRTPGPLTDTLVQDLAATTAATSLQVLTAVLRDNEHEHSSNPASRRIVHQATGMIIARYRTSSEDALLLLRAHAFAHNRTVREVAQDIVTRRDAFPDGPTSGQDDTW